MKPEIIQMIGLLSVMVSLFLLLKIIKWSAQARMYDREVTRLKKGLSKQFENAWSAGLIFSDCYTAHDLAKLAKELNITLFELDTAEIIQQIKRDFNQDTGISNEIIKASIIKWANTKTK